jgi:hypothetical protein
VDELSTGELPEFEIPVKSVSTGFSRITGCGSAPIHQRAPTPIDIFLDSRDISLIETQKAIALSLQIGFHRYRLRVEIDNVTLAVQHMINHSFLSFILQMAGQNDAIGLLKKTRIKAKKCVGRGVY